MVCLHSASANGTLMHFGSQYWVLCCRAAGAKWPARLGALHVKHMQLLQSLLPPGHLWYPGLLASFLSQRPAGHVGTCATALARPGSPLHPRAAFPTFDDIDTQRMANPHQVCRYGVACFSH